MSDHCVAQFMTVVGVAVVACSGLLLAAVMFVSAVNLIRPSAEALLSWRRFIQAEKNGVPDA